MEDVVRNLNFWNGMMYKKHSLAKNFNNDNTTKDVEYNPTHDEIENVSTQTVLDKGIVSKLLGLEPP